jgi:uncharacterized protein YndB with AHSA1/START domain
MTAMAENTIEAVRKSITVSATPQQAFDVFTKDFDSWWPRSHHIGKSPMKKAIIEPRPGGRCYTEQEDGSESDWGSVLEWEPPRRFLIAWQITGNWQFESDVAKSSEVEIRFTPEGAGKTRVDLEHRHFERLTSGGAEMRAGVGGEGGWGGLLEAFGARVDEVSTSGKLAVVLAIFTLGHTLGTRQAITATPEEAAVINEMQQYRAPVMGFLRSYWEFYRGFSITISVLLAALMVIAWQVGRLSRRNPQEAFPFAITLLVACVANAIVSFSYFFTAPMVTSTVAVACAGVAVALVRREAREISTHH